MAKFDISPGIGGGSTANVIGKPEEPVEANYEPVPFPHEIDTDSIRMGSRKVTRRPPAWGFQSQGKWVAMSACFLAVMSAGAFADPLASDSAAPTATIPDPQPRLPQVVRPPARPSWDLDGLYVWLGPSGAASRIDSQWDSTIGADVTVISVREHVPLAAIGGSLGASKWTERGGGRVWLDAMAGTEILGSMVGVSAGPLVELSDLAHPRIGGSVGVWGFFGVAPYARVGMVDQLGVFAEVGLHIPLPLLRD